MTPSRWSEIRRFFEDSLALDPAGRAAYLDRACSTDAELRAEVERLLALSDESRAAVDRPAVPESFLDRLLSARAFREGELVAGRYRIERFAGEGGMGEVYAAEDTQVRERVALKTLRAELADDETALDRFRREVQLARRVTHPNVCRVYDLQRAGEEGGRVVHFLTMEWLDGETLTSFLAREAPLTVDRGLPLARQLAAGLDAAHAAEVVHRDFKPGNVILVNTESNLRAVITDFGLARAGPGSLDATEVTGRGLGTPAYMAPEQIEGKAAGKPADIYAFGIVLYEMVTGRRPYEASTPLAMAAMKVQSAPKAPSSLVAGLDRKWERAILRCLAIDPAHRFATAGDAASALESSLAGMLAVRPRLRAKRWLGAAPAVAILAAGLWIWQRPSAPTEADAWLEQGTEALRDGVPQKAERLLLQAVRANEAFVEAHARLAEAYLDLDMAGKAKDALLKATAAISWRTPAASRDLVEAVRASALRDFAAARAAWERRLDGDPVRTQLDLGRMYERAGQGEQARKSFEDVLRRDPSRAAAHLRLGVLAGRAQKLAEAAGHFREAERLYRLTGNYEGLGEVFLARSRAYRNARNTAEAEADLDRAEQLARTTSSGVLEVRTMFEKSLLRLREGNLAEAEDLAARGRAKAQAGGLEALSAQGLNDLGIAALNQYRLEDAERYLRQAADVAERVGSEGNRARAHLNWASTRLRLGDPRGAAGHAAIATEYYRTAGVGELLQTALLLGADAAYDSGRYPEAAQRAQELTEAARKGGDTLHEALGRERQAKAARIAGQWQAALDHYQAAAALHATGGRRLHHAYALANEGAVRAEMNRTAEAEALFGKAEAIGGKAGGLAERLLWLRAETALIDGRPADAVRHARALLAAPAVGSPLRRALGLTLLGEAEARAGLPAAARGRLREAEAILRPVTNIEFSMTHRLATARVEFLVGAWPRVREICADMEEEAGRLGMPVVRAKARLLEAAAGGGSAVDIRAPLDKLSNAETVDRFLMRRDLEPLPKGIRK